MKALLRWHYSRWMLLILANGLYFCLVNPEVSVSIVLFGGFLLLAIDVYLLFRLFLRALGRLTGKPNVSRARIAVLGTVIIVILLALQSIGQLSVRDSVAVICIGAIFLFYSSYYKFGHRS